MITMIFVMTIILYSKMSISPIINLEYHFLLIIEMSIGKTKKRKDMNNLVFKWWEVILFIEQKTMQDFIF